MREVINNDHVKNEIMLLLNHPSYNNKTVVILEGSTDVKMYRFLFDKDCVKLITATGKGGVISIVSELIAIEKYAGQLMGVCDADFQHILEESNDCEDIFLTDTHDIETMILSSPAVSALVAEYSKDHDSYILLSNDLLKVSLDAALVIGIIRLINTQNGLNFKFKGLNFNEFSHVENTDISVDLDALIDILFLRSNDIPEHINKEFLLERYSEIEANDYDHMQVCCGHDVTKVISCVLRQESLSNCLNVSQNNVERALRLSYTMEYFRETRLYRFLHNWQSQHSKIILQQ